MRDEIRACREATDAGWLSLRLAMRHTTEADKALLACMEGAMGDLYDKLEALCAMLIFAPTEAGPPSVIPPSEGRACLTLIEGGKDE